MVTLSTTPSAVMMGWMPCWPELRSLTNWRMPPSAWKTWVSLVRSSMHSMYRPLLR